MYISTCFRQTYCPSSAILILYSKKHVFVILKGISKLKYFGHKMYSSDSRKKGLILVVIDGSGKYGRQCRGLSAEI